MPMTGDNPNKMSRPVAFSASGDGVNVATLTGTYTLTFQSEQHQNLDPGGAHRDVALPAVVEEKKGCFFAIYNAADAAENLVIKSGVTTIATIGQGESVLVVQSPTAWKIAMALPASASLTGTANAWTDTQTFQNVILGAASELTIAAGAVAATRSYHTIDTEADAASDDLDDITGLAAGEILLVTPANAARTVVLKHAVGASKIACPGARDISLAESTDWALLVSNGTQATVVAYNTLANGGGGLGSALASTANGLGASLVGIEDTATFYAGTNLETVLAELAIAIGGTTSTARNYTSNLVVADNDTMLTAVSKLDTQLGAYQDQAVAATITCPSPAGGVNDATLTVTLKRAHDNTTALSSARQVRVFSPSAAYSDAPAPPNASLTLVATTGSVVATIVAGAEWLVQTDATGVFAATATNTDDETAIFQVSTAGAVSDITKRAVVVGSTSVSTTWGP